MRPRYAELASRLLIRATPEAVSPMAEDRANAVLAATKAMRRKATRRRIVRALSAGAAIAAGVAIYIDWKGFAKDAVRTEPTATITGEATTPGPPFVPAPGSPTEHDRRVERS